MQHPIVHKHVIIANVLTTNTLSISRQDILKVVQKLVDGWKVKRMQDV
jgi:hypothetical protein